MDYRRVLDQYINRQIKMRSGSRGAGGKLNIDREMARGSSSRAATASRNPAHVVGPVPKDGEETELMRCTTFGRQTSGNEEHH